MEIEATEIDGSNSMDGSAETNVVKQLPNTPLLQAESPTFSTPKLLISAPAPKEWVPICPEHIKPQLNMRFDTLEKGIKFYRDYAQFCGFAVRLATQYTKHDIPTHRYCLCNREGERRASTSTTVRKRLVTRIKCHAMIAFRLVKDGTYEVYKFVEAHSHCLATPISRQSLRGQTKLNSGHKRFIFNNLKVNKGPTSSFRMWKEQVGSYVNIGASLDDFKNFYRDLKEYIKDVDGQMFVEIFYRKKASSPGFFFDFEVDESTSFSMVLWADAISRKNYALFGDSISVDATYSTNKYSMVLVPFTGVDNNKRCVTFAIGLIAKEDIASYTWLLKTFLKAMGGNQPRSVITDQDAALKVAMADVFDRATHKFCVWHIMRKMPDKVRVELRDDAIFLKKMDAIVYSRDIEPGEFKQQWKSIMAEYDLVGNPWLTMMYKMRKMWIPAYFRDMYMGGLLRTTSRSESENNFFNYFTNEFVTLVELQMRFESALDAQRHKQSVLDSKGKISDPPLKTPLPLEKHASLVYTHSLFYEFQNEAHGACYECGLHELIKEDECEKYFITHFTSGKVYTVIYDATTVEVTCSCQLFLRMGMLCKHAVWVLHTKGVHQLPRRYILDRWTKDAAKRSIFDVDGILLEECTKIDEQKKLLGEVWNETYKCVGLAEPNIDDLSKLLQTLRLFSSDLIDKQGDRQVQTKEQELEQFIGCKAPTTITIQNPKQSANKGSRKEKEGPVEKEQKIKKQRSCKTCGLIAGHNTRTCPLRKT